VAVARDEDLDAACDRAYAGLGPRVVVKPSCQGSAIGVSFASDTRQLRRSVRAALQLSPRALIERRVAGREITVPVLQCPELRALPVVEVITPKGTWYDFAHRYTPGKSRHLIPARLGATLTRHLQHLAVEAHRALGCRDVSRADFVVPLRGRPVLLEVNTIPGMTPTSLLPDSAAADGIPFDQLVAMLVLTAWRRAR
jgi:D-alanine-D-alanine ligase